MTELTLSQINGRFTIRDAGTVLPGRCSVCGNVKCKVVDFGLDIDFYGAVAICTSCFSAAAELLDLVPREQVLTLQMQQDFHDRELEEVRSKVDGFVTDLTNLYDGFINGVRSDDDTTVSPDVPVVKTDTKRNVSRAKQTVKQESNFVIDEGPFDLSGSNSDGQPPILDLG